MGSKSIGERAINNIQMMIQSLRKREESVAVICLTDEQTKIAIFSLEKQAAKKPKIDDKPSVAFHDGPKGGWFGETNINLIHCPSCGNVVGRLLAGTNKIAHKKAFCDKCGQRIDWSEIDGE